MNVRELITLLQHEDPEALVVVEGADGPYVATTTSVKVDRYGDGSLSLHDPVWTGTECAVISAVLISTNELS
jgi:hypothetical protein